MIGRDALMHSQHGLFAFLRIWHYRLKQTLDRFHSRGEMDTNILRTLAIKAFQDEHSYVQQQAAAGVISSELANALNEHISNDQLVCIQSFED